ncbi:MAG: hypothetical protein IJ308_08495 [Clostridia bacterium]|nr:hypothetical protein [Clostridia bacterium]
MKDSFVLYTKYEEQISLLSDAQAGVLLRALICYQSQKDLPEMDGMTNIVFTVIRQQIDFDNQKYDEVCAVRKASGAQGGRPPKRVENKGNKPKKPNGFENKDEKPNGYFKNQTKAKKPESDTDTDTDTDNDTDIEERKKEIYINNNLTPSACEEEYEDESELISHEDIMRNFGISKTLTNELKDFLRQCYINGHIVSNEKLEDIVFRLIDDLNDDVSRVACVRRAISGGYFDIKV